MSPLTVVREDESYAPTLPAPAQRPALPKFEGEEVNGLRAKLTSTTGLELSDDPHRIDETIAMVVTGRVVRVDHVVDERTGQLLRVETFKVVEATEIPYSDAVNLLPQGI